jgi:ABC-2 type transport system ATP-binding protein
MTKEETSMTDTMSHATWLPAAPSRDGHDPVRVRDLRKTYANGVTALHGVSFEVHEGEIFGLLGPNGAGKTTTIGILTTLVGQSGGDAFVAGRDVAADPLGVRQRIGVVFQDSVLDNDFSGADNLRLHARLFGLRPDSASSRIDALLRLMDLDGRADDGVRTYSGGMRRRLEIARGLLAGPRILFLDEPTVGLDPQVRNEIWRLVADLREREGVTIVLTTHYLEEAELVCDRVGILHAGRLVALDTPRRLVEGLGAQIVEVRVLGGTDPVASALADIGVGRHAPLVTSGTVTMPSNASSGELADVLGALAQEHANVVGTGVRRSTLNDVYLHLTGSPPDGHATTNGGPE